MFETSRGKYIFVNTKKTNIKQDPLIKQTPLKTNRVSLYVEMKTDTITRTQNATTV